MFAGLQKHRRRALERGWLCQRIGLCRANFLADVQDKDRMDVILANPPFGGKERKEVQENFTIRTGETAFLFSPLDIIDEIAALDAESAEVLAKIRGLL